MSITGLPLLLLLLLVHLLGDFRFQSSTWVDERYEKHLYSKRLYAHAAIHGALSLTVLWLLLMPSWQLHGHERTGQRELRVAMAKSPLKIAVLVSGGGTTLQNFIALRDRGELAIDIKLVISSRPDVGGLQRAADAQITTKDNLPYQVQVAL